MKVIIALLAFVSLIAHADQPTTRTPPPAPQCLDLPPEIREAWHIKPTDCPHEVPVVSACDVTPPDVAKLLGIDLHRCPKGSVANP